MRAVPLKVLIALLGLAIAAGLAFVVAGRDDAATGTGRTDESAAVAVAKQALPLALGYDYRTLDHGLAAAQKLMTPDFAREFASTFEDSAAVLARDKKAVTGATVRAAGVVRDEGDRVLCLVYVDQVLVSSQTVKDADAPVQVSQNRVLVGLTRSGDRWLVDAISPL